MPMQATSACPCQSGFAYAACCAPLHAKLSHAKTAEQLMRSRYSAYAKGLAAYLVQTRAAPMRAPTDLADIKALIAHSEWLNLRIIDRQLGTEHDDIGEVEFVASYVSNGQAQQLHERSRFIKSKQRWYYLDGDIL